VTATALPSAFDGLKLAAREVGSIQIQNAGTLAGNLCNASPAADGVPPLPSTAERDAWIAVIDPAFERFCQAVDAGADTLLDPYGASGVEEFFAVASETFFVSPKQLRAEHPDLYGLLARYFQQDPAAFTGG
jgi:Mlc titration factor MtfA (ptsG expression regulator)